MTETLPTKFNCPVCAHESEQRYVAARDALPPGPPDMDTRSFADKHEGVLAYDVWRCPDCGFAQAPVICLKRRPPASDTVATLVRSRAYRAQLADPELPELAGSYLCRAMVEAASGRFARAGWTALLAAWACDDHSEEQGARRCRLRAIELWGEAEAAGEVIVQHGLPATQLLLADVLRRAGDFERARERCHRGLSGRPAEPFRSLLEFEIELVTRECTGVHQVSEVVCPW